MTQHIELLDPRLRGDDGRMENQGENQGSGRDYQVDSYDLTPFGSFWLPDYSLSLEGEG